MSERLLSLSELSEGDIIYFLEGTPSEYVVKAKDRWFLIATAEKSYTIINTSLGLVGPHDRTFNPYDFTTEEGIQACLRDLMDGKIDHSQRNSASLPIIINVPKTLKWV